MQFIVQYSALSWELIMLCRVKILWFDGVLVTDPAALAAICGRGEGALDKASIIYTPINQVGIIT